MVLKPQQMSEEQALRAAAQNITRVEQEANLRAAIESLQLRQWCVEKAIISCGQEAVVWFGRDFVIRDKVPPRLPPKFECAVVPLAEDILRFITGGEPGK